ncbi:MAG: MmgE/PrpD family protein [Desulfobacterales bacterium]|nr:MAG: MmgE/PrpD family protein [Desulfobacterales bacterium]
MDSKVTEKLADFIARLEYSDLTAAVIDAAKEAVLDFIAVAIAGFRKARLPKMLMDCTLPMNGETESTILGMNQKISALHAALINGTSGHSLDLDDGHRQALGHPGVCVVPAALALAESSGSSGPQLLTAIVAGYEIFIRIARSMNPSLFSRGFHTTGVCGTMAAAAAAAKVLALNPEKISDTLGIGAIQSAGLLVVVHSGQMMKPLNAGKAAYNGVLSAMLAHQGADGSQNVVEEKDGFGQAFAGDWDPALMLDNLGNQFSTTECYRKLYPSCRHSHAAIDAALFLNKKEKIVVENIQKIIVTTYPAALKLTQKENMPADEPAARFNLAFAVSLALVKGRAGLAEFSMESTTDPRIQQLFEKVHFISDPSFESKTDSFRGAELEIIFSNNTAVKHKVLLPKGEPENPATPDDLEEKFKSCIGDFWTAPKTKAVMGAIRDLEHSDDIRILTKLIRENADVPT